ncbi:hypothetical protein DFJ74DRAFT_288791 [Hyaloraphidium curvatum]|nr:hypothetical protein DFJ74DRAFT_288791 [Hyaloraphidium curvatum]
MISDFQILCPPRLNVARDEMVPCLESRPSPSTAPCKRPSQPCTHPPAVLLPLHATRSCSSAGEIHKVVVGQERLPSHRTGPTNRIDRCPNPVAAPAAMGAPAAPPGADSGAELPRAVSDGLLAEFFRAVPRGATSLHRETFWEVRNASAEAPFAGDARWIDLYAAEVLVATLEWFGAVTLERDVSTGTRDAPEWLGQRTPGQLAADAEARCQALLAEEIRAFHAAAAGRSALPMTVRTLALLQALGLAAAAMSLVSAGSAAMRTLLENTAAVLHHSAAFPGALVGNPPDALLEDWLLSQYLVDAVHTSMLYTSFHALATGEAAACDFARAFPDLRLRVSLQLLTSVAPASQRVPGTPTPAAYAAIFSDVSVGDAYGWIDPEWDPPAYPARTEAVLASTMSGLLTSGYGSLTQMAFFFEYHASRFASWLADRGLRVVDLALADGPPAPAFDGQEAVLEHMRGVLAHPDLPEALRRRDHLRGAIAEVEAHLPVLLGQPPDARPSRIPDAVKNLPRDYLIPLGMIGVLQYVALQLISPDPFAEFRQGAPRDPGIPAELNEHLLTAWLASPAFAETCSRALAVAELARTAVGSFPAESVVGNVFLKPLDRAAVQAAGHCVLVLRRLTTAFAHATEHEYARAAALHTALLSDARACLDFMALARRSELEPVRLVIEGLLAGDDIRLSRRDAQMLALAAKAVSRCPHGEGGASGGSCWICASRDSSERRASRDAGQGDEDGEGAGHEALAAVPSFALVALAGASSELSSARTSSRVSPAGAGGSKAPMTRRVRFNQLVEVYQTYSPEDYPARSNAADGPDEEGQGWDSAVPAPVPAARSDFTLSALLQQRGDMPDLKRYWAR